MCSSEAKTHQPWRLPTLFSPWFLKISHCIQEDKGHNIGDKNTWFYLDNRFLLVCFSEIVNDSQLDNKNDILAQGS